MTSSDRPLLSTSPSVPPTVNPTPANELPEGSTAPLPPASDATTAESTEQRTTGRAGAGHGEAAGAGGARAEGGDEGHKEREGEVGPSTSEASFSSRVAEAGDADEHAGVGEGAEAPPFPSAAAAASTPSPADLARQLSSFRLPSSPPSSSASAPLSAPTPSAAPEEEQEEQEEEERWPLKEILWPPLPPTPEEAAAGLSGFQVDQRLRVKVVCQNRNGPCSLIALCNILLLRSSLTLPSHLTSVTYSTLSALLADYFLSLSPLPSPSTTSPPSSSSAVAQPLSLDAALSILPSTRHGLTLNPCFDSVSSFAPPASSSSSSSSTSSSSAGELSLFALARVPLLHGWLADPSPSSEEAAVLAPKSQGGCGDYDTALEWLVAGAEVAGPLGLRLEEREGEVPDEELVREVERREGWGEGEREKVRKAAIIDKFLTSTSTQLSYTGLFSLSSSPLLPPSALAALFRNSHLSVLYRRPALPPSASPSSSTPGAAPELFTLVTDSAFAHEAEVVWESLGDTDGEASEFYDAGLRRSSTRGGDFAGAGARVREESRRRAEMEGAAEGADLALAQQLQAEEDALTASAAQRELHTQQMEEERLIERERERRRRVEEAARIDPELRAPERRDARERERGKRGSVLHGKGKEGRKGEGKEKEKCLVM
ncbi:hypothetical protein JCM10213_005863 [Rhodosporidiobolus nylandii]